MLEKGAPAAETVPSRFGRPLCGCRFRNYADRADVDASRFGESP